MKLVRWCVQAGLRQDWRGLAMLTLITALMGAVALAAVAGARRTDTAVSRFLQYAGPFQGQVAGGQTALNPATMDKIAALPGIAYSEQGALMLVEPVSVDGRPAPQTSVITEATVTHPSQSRAIILAGRYPLQSRADEVALNESAALKEYARGEHRTCAARTYLCVRASWRRSRRGRPLRTRPSRSWTDTCKR